MKVIGVPYRTVPIIGHSPCADNTHKSADLVAVLASYIRCLWAGILLPGNRGAAENATVLALIAVPACNFDLNIDKLSLSRP